MTINDVVINNWQPPGCAWWDGVRDEPDEPLINATMKLTLTWNEYIALIMRDERGHILAPGDSARLPIQMDQA